jgi:hypothetical protein
MHYAERMRKSNAYFLVLALLIAMICLMGGHAVSRQATMV